MSPISFGPSDVKNPHNLQWAHVPESFWLTKALIFDYDWIVREAAHQHAMPDHREIQSSLLGLKETFWLLRKFEIRLGMTSNLKQAQVVEGLHHLNLAEDFDCIRCAEELPALKPSPALHFNVMETLGIRAVKAIAMETSMEGVQAARAAGIFCVTPADLKLPSDYELNYFTEKPMLILLEEMDNIKRRQLDRA